MARKAYLNFEVQRRTLMAFDGGSRPSCRGSVACRPAAGAWLRVDAGRSHGREGEGRAHGGCRGNGSGRCRRTGEVAGARRGSRGRAAPLLGRPLPWDLARKKQGAGALHSRPRSGSTTRRRGVLRRGLTGLQLSKWNKFRERGQGK